MRKNTQHTNPLSYEFTGHDGKIHFQNAMDFNEETQFYFDRQPPITPEQRKQSDEYWNLLHKKLFQFSIPTEVIWRQYQTPIKNQQDRNTCSGFAMVAAIEARYMRDFGLELDLSEQFFWHCYKSTSLDYPRHYHYENQSSYWGGGGSHGVVQAVNFAIPLEKACPYLDKEQMQTLLKEIPAAGKLEWNSNLAKNTVTQDQVDAFEYSPLYISEHARQVAAYGASSYRLFDQNFVRNMTDMEFLIASGHEVMVDAVLKWKQDSKGVFQYDPTVTTNPVHVFLVVGYDRSQQIFYIKSSWGGTDFIRVSYGFAQKCFLSGATVTAVTPPGQFNPKARAIGRWQLEYNGVRATLIIRRYTDEHNKITRLGHLKAPGGSPLAVNGAFLDGNRGILFHLTNGDDTDPCINQGQLFAMDIFSKDVSKAAGYTDINGTPFGSYMSTGNIHANYASGFKPEWWVGQWSMDHDGWLGKLAIKHLETVKIPSLQFGLNILTGEYRGSDNKPIPFFGYLDPRHPHILRFTLVFSEHNHQPFELYFQTHTSNLCSGVTFWNGYRFGAVAIKEYISIPTPPIPPKPPILP